MFTVYGAVRYNLSTEFDILEKLVDSDFLTQDTLDLLDRGLFINSVKEMTIDEIEKKLGHKVKIVG